MGEVGPHDQILSAGVTDAVPESRDLLSSRDTGQLQTALAFHLERCRSHQSIEFSLAQAEGFERRPSERVADLERRIAAVRSTVEVNARVRATLGKAPTRPDLERDARDASRLRELELERAEALAVLAPLRCAADECRAAFRASLRARQCARVIEDELDRRERRERSDRSAAMACRVEPPEPTGPRMPPPPKRSWAQQFKDLVETEIRRSIPFVGARPRRHPF